MQKILKGISGLALLAETILAAWLLASCAVKKAPEPSGARVPVNPALQKTLPAPSDADIRDEIFGGEA